MPDTERGGQNGRRRGWLAVLRGLNALIDQADGWFAIEQGTSVVLGHCRLLAKLRKTADMLADRLEFAAVHREELEAMLKADAAPDVRARSLKKLLGMSTHVGIATGLATVYSALADERGR